MAICDDCGAASAEGATRCAACGRSFAIGEVEFGSGGLDLPREKGSWGAGVEVEPRHRPAAVRWFTEADWRPALRAVAAPTGLLLAAALLLTITLDSEHTSLAFGTRFGVALAVVLAAFGGPVGSRSQVGGEGSPELVNQIWVLPMTVTVLWAVLFAYGLRAARRRLAPEPTIRRLLAEAGRPVLLAVAVTAGLGLLAGVDHRPAGNREELGGPLGWLFQFGFADHVTVSAGTAWSTLGSALLATALAAGVFGADRLRGTYGDWTASAAAAARALSLTVAVATVVALVLTASRLSAEVTLLGLVALPNLGLNLLGFGSGATVGMWEQRSAPPAGIDLRDELDHDFSIFDLADLTGHWRWTVLLALASALVLGWAVRRFDLVGRIRAAGFHWVGASLLMLLSGMTQWSGFDLRATAGEEFGLDSGDPVGAEVSVGLALFSVLAANLVWTAVGAFAVPLLFRRAPVPTVPVLPVVPPVLPPRPSHVPFTGEVLDSHTPEP
ncbi:hypothetical protein F4556_004311 [Kitasatospora gansuensis]|uniref:Uncharacterized protein n=1 Tax=Kitasatospora gansuensis TaxID=258050 RepID=A0A7W7SGB8_9ACTN|nr:hypothetical protein [Kitasatospora gansuensis]MBB4948776.1 hypothetical protein [Kitasatospora gansuensis]